MASCCQGEACENAATAARAIGHLRRLRRLRGKLFFFFRESAGRGGISLRPWSVHSSCSTPLALCRIAAASDHTAGTGVSFIAGVNPPIATLFCVMAQVIGH